MWKTLILLCALASAASADEPCSVYVAHAPDDIRAVVVAWVSAEPHCRVNLEVRIVPTEGGYYLFARDDTGRVRERIVPDAQSAGVLVASWVADDTTDERPASEEHAAEPAVETPPAFVETPPGMVAPMQITAVAPREQRRHWLSLGAQPGGARIALDVVALGRWSLGLTSAAIQVNAALDVSTAYIWYVKNGAYVAGTFRLGAWYARASLGVELTMAKAEVDSTAIGRYDLVVSYITPNSALMLGRLIGDNWSFHAGPIAMLATPRVGFQRMDGVVTSDAIIQTDPVVTLFAGVQRRMW